VGNALEVIEAVETLKGRGPEDVESLSVVLAARLVLMAGQAVTLAEADAKVHAALSSGAGVEKLRQIVEQQGGDPRVVDFYDNLPSTPRRMLVQADRSGYVTALDAERIGRATMILGAGRERVEDAVDHGVGAMVLKVRGEQVRAGEALLEIHYREPAQLGSALDLLRQACVLGDAPPPAQAMVLDTVH
jgi:thymidine phosphorylase